MPNYYLIANKDERSVTQPHSNQWPKMIAFSIDTQTILLAEGSGHGMSGCNIPVSDFDENDWSSLFKKTNSEWFLDFLRRTSLPVQKDLLEQEMSKHKKIELRKF